MLHRGLNRHEAAKEAARLLGHTGIDQPETRLASYPHQLSGARDSASLSPWPSPVIPTS